jgi:hypothetical protein
MRATVAYPVSAFSETNWDPSRSPIPRSVFARSTNVKQAPIRFGEYQPGAARRRLGDMTVSSNRPMHHFAPLTPDARTAFTSVLGCSGQRFGGGTRRRWNAAGSPFRPAVSDGRGSSRPSARASREANSAPPQARPPPGDVVSSGLGIKSGRLFTRLLTLAIDGGLAREDEAPAAYFYR